MFHQNHELLPIHLFFIKSAIQSSQLPPSPICAFGFGFPE
jgi:hypothetical protein